jgi:type I restriction enzyme R subunit
VDAFCQVFYKSKAAQSPTDHAMMNATIDPAVGRFRQLEEEAQEEFRSLLNTFRNLYGFLAQVIPSRIATLRSSTVTPVSLPPNCLTEPQAIDTPLMMR